MIKIFTLCAAIAFMQVAPEFVLSSNAAGVKSVQQTWIPASKVEQDAARGGYWQVSVVGAMAVVRWCTPRITTCATITRVAFSSGQKAKIWACKNYGTLC